ncbi:MAG: Ku protein [Alphaproteobacteria bacterium]|nr:Ku protein [Alphaproteobacteria bacterium]
MSLVSIPVHIFNAIDSDGDVHFNQIHRPSGERVRYTKTVPGIGEIDSADIVKGFEFEKNRYIVVEPEELKALKLESSDSFNIVQFVDREAIDPLYFNAPYYVAPAEEGAVEGFVVIRDALRETGKAGIGQIVLSGRERLACIQPCGKGMLMETLRYKEDLRSVQAYFAPITEIKADKDQIELAQRLIEQKVADFQPDLFEDHYETAVRQLIEQKRKGKRIITAKEPERPSAEVIDIMDALRRSVAKGGKGGGGRLAANDSAPRPAKRRRASHR